MNIVYLSSAELPSRSANSIHVVKMCQAFAANGHEVTLFANVADAHATDESIFQHYGVSGGFTLRRLPRLSFPYGGHIAGYWMARETSRLAPDFVIGRHPTGCFFSMLRKMATYFETHGPISESGRLTQWLFGRMIRNRNMRKLILITNSLGAFYREQYDLAENRLLILPDGADPVPEGTEPKAGVRIEGKVNIGYTGHLYAGKGMEIISALALLCPEHHFHVVGGKEDDIARWRRETASSTNITFHGYVPHSDIPAYLATFDIVLLPNQRQVTANGGRDIGSWTSPLKLFEYMAAGKAIICSDLPVLREAAEDGHNAILCPHDDVGAWRAAIDRLVGDDGLRERISHNAKADLELRYSWQSRTAAIVEDFATLRTKSSPARPGRN